MDIATRLEVSMVDVETHGTAGDEKGKASRKSRKRKIKGEEYGGPDRDGPGAWTAATRVPHAM